MTTTSHPHGGEVSDTKPAGSDSRSLSASVRRGALWVVATNVLLRFANVFITAVVAHILSPHDFGVFAVALTAYAIVSSLAELGVTSCLMRADLDIDRLAPTVASVSILSGHLCQAHRSRARVGSGRRASQGHGARRIFRRRIRGTELPADEGL
jgi:cation transporter-like permease